MAVSDRSSEISFHAGPCVASSPSRDPAAGHNSATVLYWADMEENENNEMRRRLAVLESRVEQLERAAARGPARTAEKPSGDLSFTPPPRPSLESRLGSQLFNRVGILAVLVGVALFLKYAADQGRLGPGARVLIGLGAGVALIAWSERFRTNGFPVFSFSLKAAGAGVLYLALWASFALFHLVSFPLALLGMVLVTAGNAWLCWAQRSELLAAYALTGGFLTPALLEPTHTSVAVLGIYLLVLNAGILALLALRRWPRLLPGAFTGTVCYLLAWGARAEQLRADGKAAEALAFAVFFFLFFSVCPLFLQPDESRRGRGLARATSIANAGLSTLAIFLLLPRTSFAAHWLLCGAALWFGLLLVAARSRQGLAPIRTVPVNSALAIALAAVGMWVALQRGGVILGWAMEAATLLWLAQRLTLGADPHEGPDNRRTLVLRSPLAAALLLPGAGTLLVAESTLRTLGASRHVFLNERFALFLAAVAVCIFGVRIAARLHALKPADGDPPELQAVWSRMGAGCALLATLLLLAAGIFEIRTYWADTGLLWGAAPAVAERFTVSAWAAALGLGLLIVGFRVRWAFLRWQALTLLTLAIAKVFLLDARALTQGFRILSFLGLGVLLLAVSFIYQRDLLNLRGSEHSG
jgi:uncharacterized membrane protein